MKVARKTLAIAGAALMVVTAGHVAAADTYAPSAVTSLTAVRKVGVARGVRLTWNAPSDAVSKNLTNYKVEYQCPGTAAPCTGSYILVQNKAPATDKTAAVTLDVVAPVGTGNKTLTYRVTAQGTTDSVTYDSGTAVGTVKIGDKPTIITTPFTLTASAGRKIKVLVKSTAYDLKGSSLTTAVVEYSAKTTGPWTKVTLASGWGLNKSTTVTVPKAATKYYFRLTVNSTGTNTTSTPQVVTSKK